ncbi:hypothetical protein C8R43DRAFT_1132079 [Mycena crocata]|nr:hypothetical protein C8R43DRAFT_1132079 [Mycena crocata]
MSDASFSFIATTTSSFAPQHLFAPLVAAACFVLRPSVLLHPLSLPLWLSHRRGAGPVQAPRLRYRAENRRRRLNTILRLPIEEQILIHSTRRLYQRIKGDIYAVKRIINVWDPTTTSAMPIKQLKIGLSTDVPRRQQNYREKRIERLAHLTLRQSGAVADRAQCTCIVCHQEFYNLKDLSTEDAMVDGWVKTTHTGSGQYQASHVPASKTSTYRVLSRALADLAAGFFQKISRVLPQSGALLHLILIGRVPPVAFPLRSRPFMPLFAKNPTWRNFKDNEPVEKVPRRDWANRLLDRAGRAITRKVNKDGGGVPMQQIASVYCVTTDTVEKALRNDDHDNLDDDVKFIEQYCRERFNPAEAQASTTSRYSTRSKASKDEQTLSVVTVSAGSRSVDLDAAEQPSTEDAEDDDHSSVEHDQEVDELDSDTADHFSGDDEASVATSHDKHRLPESPKLNAKTVGRARRYARDDASREYWPNPRAINFKTLTAISLPSDMGTRSPSKKVDRPGRAISRIMDNHNYTAAHIGRIYNGVTHNVIGRSIKNLWCPPDDISYDYVKAGRDYYEHFPPADATCYVIPPEWTTGNNIEIGNGDEVGDTEDEHEPPEDTHNTLVACGNDPTTNDEDAHNSLFTDDEEADAEMPSSDNKHWQADEEEVSRAIQSPGPYRQVNEASEALRVKHEAERISQRPNKREHSVIYISDDEAPPAKRKNTIQTTPLHSVGLKVSTSPSRNSAGSIRGGVEVKVEGEDTEGLMAFLAAVPGGGLSRLYDVCVQKGVRSRLQLEGWVHLTEMERLRNIGFLFGGHLNQYEIGLLDTALLRLFATLE